MQRPPDAAGAKNRSLTARFPMRPVALVLACWLNLGAATARADKGPEPLPDDVVKVWKEAGAEVGWMGPDKRYAFRGFATKIEDLDAAHAVPAFAIRRWREGMLAKLP